MCYSKEVQLITALLLIVGSSVYYLYFRKKYHTDRLHWTSSFALYLYLAGLAIGMHQLFEFLSLITNNQTIYKIGLLSSILFPYFLIKNLESLVNRKLHSWIALIIILGVAIHLFLVDMTFSSYHFHLRHNNVFIWVFFWFLIFFYWHVCAIKAIKKLNNKTKKAIYYYFIATTDFSLLVAVIYSIIGYFRWGVNFCTDAPSIWCTFAVMQLILFPFLIRKIYQMIKRPRKQYKQTVIETIINYLIALVILIILTALLPFFNCLTWKFVFP